MWYKYKYACYQEKETAGMVNKDFKEVLARLMRLRQACNHPLLVSSGLLCTSSSAEIARNLPYGSSKLKATLEILSDGLVQKGVKTLVFTQCTKMLDLLEDSLEESSLQYRRFDGKMSMESRHKSIEEFKNLPKVIILLRHRSWFKKSIKRFIKFKVRVFLILSIHVNSRLWSLVFFSSFLSLMV